MSTISDFKGSFFNAIMEHGKQLVRPAGLIILVVGLLFGLITFFIGQALIGQETVADIMATIKNGPSPEAIMGISEIIQERVGEMFVGLLVFALVMYLVQGVVVAFFLKTSEAVLKKEETSPSAVIKRLTQPILVQSILVVTVVGVISQLIGGVRQMTIADMPMINLIFSIFLGILFMRLVAANPAVVHGEMNWKDALTWSWQKITWKRAALIYLAIIGASIGIGLVFVLVTFLSAALGKFGAFLILFLILFLFVIGVAFYLSFLSGVYYRYAELDSDSGSSAEDHLIIDEADI
jgi:hypothetical protein